MPGHLLRQRRAAPAGGCSLGGCRRARRLLADAAGPGAARRRPFSRAAGQPRSARPVRRTGGSAPAGARRAGADGGTARSHHEPRSRHPPGYADRQCRGADRGRARQPSGGRRRRRQHARADAGAARAVRPARAALHVVPDGGRVPRRRRRRRVRRAAWRGPTRAPTTRCRSTCTCRSARSAAPTAAATWSSRRTATWPTRYLDYLEREIDLLAGAPAASAPRLAAALGRRHADLLLVRRSWSACSRSLAASLHVHARRRDRRRDRSARDLRRAARPRSRRLGFNRLSMGVQDFAPEVQEAVNRIQSYEQTQALVDARARARLPLDQHRPDLRPAVPDAPTASRGRSSRCSRSGPSAWRSTRSRSCRG